MKEKDYEGIELPDARSVNRAITAELKAAREKEKLARAGAGSWAAAARRAATRFPNDPMRQLVALHNTMTTKAAIGRERTVSAKSHTDRFMCLTQAIEQLREEGIHVRNVLDLSQNHVLTLARRWQMDNLVYRTIEGRLSHLRRFLTLLGKPETVPRKEALYRLLSDNGVTVHHVRRSMVASESQSWSARGVDPALVIRRMAQEDPLAAMLLELMWAFGLRRQEAYYLSPAACDEGNRLLVLDGTKGGRPRAVEFSTDARRAQWQRDVLDRAKEMARKHPQRKLAIRGYSAKQMRNYLAAITVKYGLTKRRLGVTLHGLRHEYAEAQFRELSNLPSPAAAWAGAQVPAAVYRENLAEVEAARQKVSEQVGHWRVGITSAYLGSVPSMERKARNLMTQWITRFEGNDRAMQLLHLAGVADAWIGGRIGMGLPLPEGMAVMLWVRPGEERDGQDWPATAAALAHALQHPVAVAVWQSPGVPEDALELRVRPLRERVDEPDGGISGQEAQPGQ